MAIDTAVVQERLLVMRQLLADLGEVGAITAERLERDRLTRHAVERIITQLVDVSVSINSHVLAAVDAQVPGTYRESFAAVAERGLIPVELAAKLAPSAGMRNILTHEYVKIDLTQVAAAVPVIREVFSGYVASVARFLTR